MRLTSRLRGGNGHSRDSAVSPGVFRTCSIQSVKPLLLISDQQVLLNTQGHISLFQPTSGCGVLVKLLPRLEMQDQMLLG